MNVDVKVDYAQITALRLRVGKSINEGLIEGGNDAVELAAQLAPKDTGELSQSGQAVSKSITSVEISFGNDLPDNRAVAQEYGTLYQPAQPYVMPAIKQIDFARYIVDKLLPGG